MTETVGERTTSRLQDAVRLLLLINGAAVPLDDEASGAPPDAVAALRSQLLLQKLDFWLRNPDYFSNMLLDRYDQSHEPWLLETAREVMNSREPDLRRYPMLRYRFGAYEPLDDALAVLAAPGLVVRRRDGTAAHTRQHVYYLTAKGRETAELVISDAPALKYYVDRVAVLVRATRGQGGTELKDEQYRQPEYANTAYNDRIGPITERVRERIDTYREGTP